jgi:hypothetical protein
MKSCAVRKVYSAPVNLTPLSDSCVIEANLETGEIDYHFFEIREDACRFARRMMAEQVVDGSQEG